MCTASNIRQNLQNFAADLDRKLKSITEAAFETVKRIAIRQDEDTPGWRNHTITPAEERAMHITKILKHYKDNVTYICLFTDGTSGTVNAARYAGGSVFVHDKYPNQVKVF